MSQRTWTLVAVVLGSGIVFLDSTIVNVALRAIGEQLPTSVVGVLEGQSYVVNGYLLSLSALLILAGALADRYGRRRYFVNQNPIGGRMKIGGGMDRPRAKSL